MAQRRSDIVDAAHPGIYHCMSRCVRKQRLLAIPGRRAWLAARLQFLAQHAGIDVLAFALMVNHLHLLLRTRPDLVAAWSDREIAVRRVALLPNKRRRKLFGSLSKQSADALEVELIMSNPELIKKARRDLSDLGFFHRLLKEPSARIWNRDDRVTGHFWDGRFKSPRVLDSDALRRVARYIELNEIRAGGAHSLTESRWSSIVLQIQRLADAIQALCVDEGLSLDAKIARLDQLEWKPAYSVRDAGAAAASGAGLAPGHTESATSSDPAPAMPSLLGYLHRVDQSGRDPRPGATGSIARTQPSAVRSAFAKASAALSHRGALAKAAADRLLEWWFTVTGSVVGPFSPPPHASLAPALQPALKGRGSCYGSRESVALEAARRNQRWLIAIPGSA